MQTLYIVSTPIGNLQDITARAMEVLLSVDVIACEDTRRTGMLLSHIREVTGNNARPRLLSYFEHNEQKRIPEILNLLLNGSSVALVSDAGTPLISDPGFKLTREVVASHIPIEVIPGVSATITALTISGLPTDSFSFYGYLSRKEGQRIKKLEEIKAIGEISKTTAIFYETPHRLLKSLESMREVFGDIDIVICRELTKVHEEVIRNTISEVINHFHQTPPKGEFVILFSTKDRLQ